MTAYPCFRSPIAFSYRDNMVYIAAWDGPIPAPGLSVDATASIPAYLLILTKSANAQFQQFVDAGGYSDSRYWAHLDFGETGWSEAVLAFTDQTGQPGPAGWELGSFIHGTDNLPVTGVSWFEASAYARFLGKQLPTLYHWYRAALDYWEIVNPVAPAIIKQSNFAGQGLAPVGQYGGLSFFGAYDMGGNAREWLANADGDLRWIAGGAWNQVPYMFTQEEFALPYDRGPTNGFRFMVNADDSPVPEALTLATREQATWADSGRDPPVSDEIYAIYRDQFGLRQTGPRTPARFQSRMASLARGGSPHQLPLQRRRHERAPATATGQR